ncbi:hypothetical protein ACP70R_000016 [Stipagrostis hirtigluma subsp. patula]
MSNFVGHRVKFSPAMLAHLPDEVHGEILVRFPANHDSLLRASHVCYPWRRLVKEPDFHRRFRDHYRNSPPLIGVFHNARHKGRRRFIHVGAPVAAGIFCCRKSWWVLGYRHGRVLFLSGRELILWDPLTHKLEVVLVFSCGSNASVTVYSSDPSGWSDMVSHHVSEAMCGDVLPERCVVIEKILYQPLSWMYTLSFDLERRRFEIIGHPTVTKWMGHVIMRLDDGVLGLAVADNDKFELRVYALEARGWVMRRRLHLNKFKPLSDLAKPGVYTADRLVRVVDACDHGNVIFQHTILGAFLLNVDSVVLKRLHWDFDPTEWEGTLYPYESFFAPGDGPIQKLEGSIQNLWPVWSSFSKSDSL